MTNIAVDRISGERLSSLSLKERWHIFKLRTQEAHLKWSHDTAAEIVEALNAVIQAESLQELPYGTYGTFTHSGLTQATQELIDLQQENAELNNIIDFVLESCVLEEAGSSTHPFAYLWQTDWDEFKDIVRATREQKNNGQTNI